MLQRYSAKILHTQSNCSAEIFTELCKQYYMICPKKEIQGLLSTFSKDVPVFKDLKAFKSNNEYKYIQAL